MGLAWAFGWACVGGVIELLSNLGVELPWFSLIDMWPQTLAIPGFVLGVAFSVVLGIAARSKRFDELSVKRFALWGGLAGATIGALLLSAGLLAPLFPNLLARSVVVLAPFTLLSAGCASASLAIARKATQREPELLTDR
jgi:hypothetical protein